MPRLIDASLLRISKLFIRTITPESTMAQAQTQTKPKPASRQQSGAHNALALLMEDHKNVKKMFKDFEKLKQSDGSDDAKAALVEKICMELTVHAQVEEEILYPAVREAIDDDDLMDEADVEHAEAKELISQLEGMKPGDDHYDAKVTVLGENIEHHVEEEEGEMFPKAKKAKLDIVELGEQIAARKKELQRA